MPVKKIARTKVSAASKKSSADASATSTGSTPPKRQFGGGAMVVTAMCVTGAVIVIAAHELTPSARVSSSDTRPDAEVVSMPPKPAAPAAADPSLAASNSETDASKTPAANTAPVTIFGCLERSNETYRLTDTDGVDAPKARSWKRAFLKKGAAVVEVVDPGNHARLSSHVGHRVGVTGTLSDRQLQVRSIRRIASSCSN